MLHFAGSKMRTSCQGSCERWTMDCQKRMQKKQ